MFLMDWYDVFVIFPFKPIHLNYLITERDALDKVILLEIMGVTIMPYVDYILYTVSSEVNL